MSMTKWLCVFPEVFIFKSDSKLLFFNSKNKQIFSVHKDDTLEKMYNFLQEPSNTYVVELNDELCNKYSELLGKVEAMQMGKVVTASYDSRPLSYPPVLKLEKDLSRIRNEYKQNKAGDILNYFRELTIYLSGDINNGYIHKQTIYPLLPSSLTVDNELLSNFLKTLEFCPVNFVNIVISSIDDIGNYYNIFQYLIEKKYNVRLFLKAELYQQIKEQLNMLNLYEIVLVSTLDEYQKSYLQIKENKVKFNILIESDIELSRVEEFLSNSNTEIVPIFNNNSQFFEKEVYNRLDDITQCGKKEILAKTVINHNYYGKFTVFPNGHIYSNVNIPPLGNISEQIYELIYKELDGQRAWLLTRDAVEPCKDCVYKYLCPSISNYEYACGKFNLCYMAQ